MNTSIQNQFDAAALTDLVSVSRTREAIQCRFGGSSSKYDGLYHQDYLACEHPAFMAAWIRMEAIPDTTPGSIQYRVDMAKSAMQESPRRWLLLQNQRRIASCEWEGLEFTTADPKAKGWQPTVALQLKMLKPDGSIGPCRQVTSWAVLEANFPGCTDLLQRMAAWKLSPSAMVEAIRQQYLAVDTTLEKLGLAPRSLASLDQEECMRDTGAWVSLKWSAVMGGFTVSRFGRESGILLTTIVPSATADAMYPGFTAQFKTYQGMGMSASEIMSGMRSLRLCGREDRVVEEDAVGISIA